SEMSCTDSWVLMVTREPVKTESKPKVTATCRCLNCHARPQPGPGQAQHNFNSDATVSRELNLLRQGASDVINGNMITLPVAQGILYVQPVYVRSTGETSYPVLRKVLVAFGDEVGFADTFAEALDQVF